LFDTLPIFHKEYYMTLFTTKQSKRGGYNQ